MFLKKKALIPVVAVTLLLIVVVLGVVVFKNWFDNYTSVSESEVEEQKTSEFLSTKIDDTIIGTNIYLDNKYDNLTIIQVKINSKECNISKNVSKGYVELNVSSCILNIDPGKIDVSIITDKGVISKKLLLRKKIVSEVSLGGINFNGANYSVVWAKKATCSICTSWAKKVKVDKFGNIYVVGEFRDDNINFGNGVIATFDGNYNKHDFFLVKYNSDGVAQWVAETTGGLDDDIAKDLVIDNEGNIYVVGEFLSSNLNFGNGVSISNDGGEGTRDIFLVKYNSDGVAQWALDTTGGTSNDYVNAIAIDNLSNIYITGETWSNLNFGNGINITPTSWTDVYIVKFNSSGTPKLKMTGSGNFQNRGKDLFISNQGNIFVTGFFFSDSINFGNSVVLNNENSGGSGSDFYLVKYNSSGIAQWAKKSSGSLLNDEGEAIFVDKNENLFVSGNFYDKNISFDSITLLNDVGGNNYDLFFVKFNSLGTAQWALDTTGGNVFEYTTDLIVDELGNSYLSGYTSSSNLNFGNGINLTNDGSSTNDPFLVKFDNQGNPVWILDTTLAGSSDQIEGVVIDSFGNIYVVGGFASLKINFSSNVSLSRNWNADFFLVKIKNNN